ncbi:SanA/YdcF family protein [Demequina sp.]|uniref:SanA/YdcF family protein n=1 Tax=Demequina sp. TaxID=2050685 RepID=UPI003D10BC6D
MSKTPAFAAAGTLGAAALAVLTPAATARLATIGARRPIASGRFHHAEAALVLGARVWADGRPSRFLRERVVTGVRLYRMGLVDRIIMSGAGEDSSGYGEPPVMRRVAEAAGVPSEHIIEDPLGVDTYSSCIRARDEYGMRSVIVATQEFHLPRAVWLCERLGLDAQGAYPPVILTEHTIRGHVRELGATGKAMLDLARGRDPQG